MKNIIHRAISRFGNLRKVTILLALITCVTHATHGQVDMFKYYRPNFSLFNPYDFVKVEFSWNMAGNIQAHLNEAINNLEEKNSLQALVNLDEAIKLDSTLWISHYYRGVCNKQLLQFKDAEIDFLKTQALNPSLAEPNIELGKLYALINVPAKAKIEFNKAIKRNPGLANSYLGLGNIALLENDTQKAEEFFDKCIQVNPNFSAGYLMKGILKIRYRNELPEAVAHFDQAIKADTAYSLAYFWKGVTLLWMNEPEKCLTEWDKVIQFNPENPFLIMMRGCLYIELEDFEKAFIDLKNALHFANPVVAGQTVMDENDVRVAANYLVANGYGLDEEIFSLLKKSFCQMISGRGVDALNTVTLAEKKQTSSAVYFIKAIILDNNLKIEEAFKYYDLALSLEDDLYFAHQRKVEIHMKRFQLASALTETGKMLRIRPDDLPAYRYRGMIESLQGNHDQAIQDFDKFLSIDSTNLDVILRRVECYEKLNKRNDALHDLLKIANENPWNWEVCEKISDNYLALGDSLKAIDFLNKHTVNNPGKINAGLKKLEILITMKKWKEVSKQVDVIEATEIPSANIPDELSKLNLLKGLIAFHAADYKEAIRLFTRAIDHSFNNMESRYYRAKCSIAVDEYESARYDLSFLKSSGYRDSEQLYNSITGKEPVKKTRKKSKKP